MVAQSHEELMEHLREQIGYLRASSGAFDEGATAEYKRLAHTLRLLLHQTRVSHALLSQVGMRDTMEFWDSAGEVSPYNMLAECTLVAMSYEVRPGEEPAAQYCATLEDSPPPRFVPPERWIQFFADYGRPWRLAQAWLPFDAWWSESVVRMLDHGCLSRMDLVLAVANKDGGSHVDPRIADEYAALSRGNALGWTVGISDVDERPLGNPVPGAIRQITHEVMKSLDRALPPAG